MSLKTIIHTTRLRWGCRGGRRLPIYSPAATILEPEELRRLVHDWAGAIAAQYEP